MNAETQHPEWAEFRDAPYDIDVEQALLGAFFVDNRDIGRVSDILQPQHFYEPLHQRIFEVIVTGIQSESSLITPLTLHAKMKADPRLIEAGGLDYLANLAAAAPAFPRVNDYARIIRSLAMSRRLIGIGEDIINRAHGSLAEWEPHAQLEAADAALHDLRISEADHLDNDGRALSASEWCERDLPEPERMLGDFLTTTSRLMIVAPTGIGKTMLALSLAFAAADGTDFLHWPRGRPARVLFIDGEMSRRLMRSRIDDAARRHGGMPENLFVLCRDDFPDMPPLNTVQGQRFIDQHIEKLGGVDLIVFDNVQALLVGDMKDEESWQQTLPWIRALTARNIGQIWVHHTGHDKSRSYGTSTREWQLDTVMLLEKIEGAEAEIAFKLKFLKARERAPHNRDNFAEVAVALTDDVWSFEPVGPRSAYARRIRLAAGCRRHVCRARRAACDSFSGVRHGAGEHSRSRLHPRPPQKEGKVYT
ncbi:MAG TPA: DnaB-like helicase N-terminal domain-containing protein [Rhizomicrobium sp.]|jgi:hypothetical protein|nr:DnaB-like helicase N-terminal domain-containing protein [Rhizomicrobium sp.]